MLYMPGVIRADGMYKMWYVGTSGPPRPANCHLGYATSQDGIHWEEFPSNPIVTDEALQDAGGWGRCFQSPFVLYDLEERRYRMWFSALTHYEETADGELVEMTQQVGYAESPDGIAWEIHPEPVTRSGRCPSVIKEDDGTFTMWVNARPAGDPDPKRDLRSHHALALARRNTLGRDRRRAPTGRHLQIVCLSLRDARRAGSRHVARRSPRGAARRRAASHARPIGRRIRRLVRPHVCPLSGRPRLGRAHGASRFSAEVRIEEAFDARYTRLRLTCSSCRAAMCFTTRRATCRRAGCRPTAPRAPVAASLTAISAMPRSTPPRIPDPTLRYAWSIDGEPRTGRRPDTLRFSRANGGRNALRQMPSGKRQR